MKVIEAITTIDYKDMVARALWTFLEAFLGTVVLGLESVINTIFNGDWRGAYVLALALLIGGASAGFSAIKTVVLETIREIKVKGEISEL